jgi:hypothetical protein
MAGLVGLADRAVDVEDVAETALGVQVAGEDAAVATGAGGFAGVDEGQSRMRE